MLDYLPNSAKTKAVDQVLLDRQELLQQLQANLTKAQENMKYYVDSKRRDESFRVGDNVLVKLQPCRQTTIASRNSNKLSACYFGPFVVIKKIGQVAYKLALPATARIHNVFHVSLLKLFKGPILDQPLPLPPEIVNYHLVLEPHMVLQHKVISKEGMVERSP